MAKEKKLVWIDLEMTGLNPETDVILEIASIITDVELNIVATGPNIVIHYEDEVLNRMNEWCVKQHGASGLTQRVKESTTALQQAEEETLSFIKQHCKENNAPLCGNSIWVDRVFMQRQMPTLEKYFHYKNVDVSSVKELVRYWYPKSSFTEFKKAENHRALEDIQGSIDELKHFRQHFFIPNQ